MRFVNVVVFVALLGIGAGASAARGVASATIVVPVAVAAVFHGDSLSVTVQSVRDGAHQHVTVAFN